MILITSSDHFSGRLSAVSSHPYEVSLSQPWHHAIECIDPVRVDRRLMG